MTADDRRDGAADDDEVLAAGLLADGLLQPGRVLVRIRGHDRDGQRRVVRVVVAEVGQDRLEGLLAAAAHAAQREGPVEVERELGLDVELAAHLCRRRRDATALGQGVEALQREVALDEVAGVAAPLVQLARGEAVGRLADGLDGQELGTRGGQKVVQHVQLEVGMLVAHHLGRGLGGLDAGGQPAREGQVQRGHALLRRCREDLVVTTGRHGRRADAGTLAHALVKVVRGHVCPHVVEVLLPVQHVREGNDLDTERLRHGGREVRARVADDVAVALRAEALDVACGVAQRGRGRRGGDSRPRQPLRVGHVVGHGVRGGAVTHPAPRSWA